MVPNSGKGDGVFLDGAPKGGKRSDEAIWRSLNHRLDLAGYSIFTDPAWRAKMPEGPPSASLDRELTSTIVAAYVRCNQIGSDQLATLISTRAPGARRSGKTGSRSRRRANIRGADPSISSPGLCRLPGMRVARPDAQTAYRRSRVERRAVSSKVEPTTGSPDHGPRLF